MVTQFLRLIVKAEMAAQSFPAVSRSDENTSLLADEAESYPLNTFLQLGYVEKVIQTIFSYVIRKFIIFTELANLSRIASE